MGTELINYHGEKVKYHNDFNKIALPSFDESELNLLFIILAKVKNIKAGETVNIYPKDFCKMTGKNYTNKELADIILTLKTKFFKADFTILLETEKEIGNATINLFQTMTIWCVKDNPYNGNDFSKNFTRVELILNPLFEYILNDLLNNFTEFELTEFVNIKGKYAKILYYHLKQFRSTGEVFLWENDFEKFKKTLNIPTSYKMSEIERRVLIPAIKELKKERNLFDMDRIPFKNLRYDKIKKKGGKTSTSRITGIVFYFDKEITKPTEFEQLIQENAEQAQKIERLEKQHERDNQENYYLHRRNAEIMSDLGLKNKYERYKGVQIKNDNGEMLKIVDIGEWGEKIEVMFKNQENETTFQKIFPTENHLRKYIETFSYRNFMPELVN